MVKEGLDMYMAGESWDKARDIARHIAPRLVTEMTWRGEQLMIRFLTAGM